MVTVKGDQEFGASSIISSTSLFSYINYVLKYRKNINVLDYVCTAPHKPKSPYFVFTICVYC